MVERTSCPRCGSNEAEDVAGLWICQACGAPLPDGAEAVFGLGRYRLRRRASAPGLGFLGIGWPAHLLDEGGAELARVKRARPSPRRSFALLAGALVLAGGLVGLFALGEATGLGPWLVYLGAPLLATLGLQLTARLSPGPDLLLVQSGRDPRLLLHVRPVREAGARCALAVEDAHGTVLGELDLDRLRAKPSAWGRLEGHLRVSDADGHRVEARRLSRLRPGTVYEDARGEPVATHGLSGGMRWDELQLTDAPPVDPRLLVAASLVAQP